MDKQAVYNKVKQHLLTQGKKSLLEKPIGSIVCAYRGVDGSRCAIGCLIKDEHCSPILEGDGIFSQNVQEALAASDPSMSSLIETDKSLLSELQRIHDASDPSEWKEKLETLAIEFNLDPVR